MKTIQQEVKERSFFHYSTRKDSYSKQRFVMDVFARLRRQRKWKVSSVKILLSEIWAEVNEMFIRWSKIDQVKSLISIKPNPSKYYSNRPSGAYTGD